jgi:hypothetical protein
MQPENTASSDDPGSPDRRDFLKKCGTFAAVTPPAAMLRSTSLTSKAIAKLGRGGGTPRRGRNGVGNGYDPQPRGNPRVDDDLGRSSGNSGNKK